MLKKLKESDVNSLVFLLAIVVLAMFLKSCVLDENAPDSCKAICGLRGRDLKSLSIRGFFSVDCYCGDTLNHIPINQR